MKVLVDADACPVKDIIIRICRDFGVKVVMVVSPAHIFQTEVELILVDSGFQAVDIEIFNRVESGDIVVTEDKGLAAIVLSRRASVMSPRGRIFSEQKIDQMLEERHLAAKRRRAGLKTKGPRALTKADKQRFKTNFTKFISKASEWIED